MNDFELIPEGIARVLKEKPAVDALERRAAKVVAEAKATGPRGAHGGRHEIDALSVGATETTIDGTVVNIDWASSFWHLLEFGSINSPPYRIVTRSAQNNGLQVIDNRQGAIR